MWLLLASHRPSNHWLTCLSNCAPSHNCLAKLQNCETRNLGAPISRKRKEYSLKYVLRIPAWWSECCLMVFLFAGRWSELCSWWSECCLLVFHFAGVWALGGGCRLRRFPARPGGGPLAICRARSGALVRRRHGHGAASCASGDGKSISSTMVHRTCTVRCAGTVVVVTPTDAWWTHPSPRTHLGAQRHSGFYIPTFVGYFKAILGNPKTLLKPTYFNLWPDLTTPEQAVGTFESFRCSKLVLQASRL